MAEESRRKRLREEGTCPICLEYFRDPVMLSCGHNFCRGCITKSWDGTSEEAPCPQCREKVQTGSLRENRQLASLIQIAKELSDVPKQEGICEFHQEPLKLFCQDDGAPICVVCDRSKEHRSHVVVPLEEAAQDIKDRLNSSLENLRKMRENILVYEVQNEKESQDLLKQVEAEREKTTAAFRELRQCLDEQEKLQLAQMEEVEKEIAEESCRKRLQEEATCSICLEYFRDPVMLCCGHNFCRACITQSWGEESTEAPCPQCREKVQAGSLKPNRQLASLIQIAKELSNLLRQEDGGQEICRRHQEPLKLFCQDDGAPICVVCDRSKEHRSHLVVPLEEAAQEFQDRISCSLENLRKKRENILVYEVENEKESQVLLKQVEAEREKTRAVFKDLHQFLEEQEMLLLAQMEEVEKEIARRRDEHLARLSSSLDCFIHELEEKQRQQSANELLQNLGNILERCQKESFENPVAFPVALKWRIHDFSDISPFLESIKKQFQDSLVSGLQLQKANVTLDPGTAHRQLILSEDRKSVRCGEALQDLPNNPERFDIWHFVLGSEGFSSGRHFWEVTVGSEERWAVGVARKSVRRKGKFDYSPKDGFMCMGKWDGKYKICNPPEYTTLSLSQELKKIRVTLDCAGGRVAFFNADTGVQLHVYSEASFCGETLLPFFFVVAGGQLTLCS